MQVLAAIGIWFGQVVYGVLKLAFPPRRKVLLLSRQSDRVSRDFRMLAEKIEALDETVEIVIRCRRLSPGLAGRLGYLGELFAQTRHLADASVCVIEGYIIPVSVLNHRPSLTVIQAWHALGAIKKFGWQSLDREGGHSSAVAKAMRMHRNYDIALCGGPGSIPHFAEAFAMDPARIRPLGMPRVDFLLAHAHDTVETSDSAQLRELAERFPRLREPGKVVVLYAPTFRNGVASDFASVVSAFADDRYTLVLKPHFRELGVPNADNVVIAAGVDIARLLPLADVVVTDYSAVAFEALVLGRDVYFYVYDLDDYARRHGLNIDPLAKLPSLASRDIGEIVARVEAGAYDREAAQGFAEKYAPQGGGCTRAIAELVLTSVESGTGR